MKKRYIIISLSLLMIIIALLTNPTKEDYISFRNKQGAFIHVYDKAGNKVIKLERVNFYIFSTYTPFIYVEPGMTHLGMFGHFFQISDGQFDYPSWLELFDHLGVKE
jgi:hypothetical protein